MFSDAVADFSDSGSIPEIKERLQDSLDSGADVERVDIKETKFSGSSEDKDFNGGKIGFTSHVLLLNCLVTFFTQYRLVCGKTFWPG